VYFLEFWFSLFLLDHSFWVSDGRLLKWLSHGKQKKEWGKGKQLVIITVSCFRDIRTQPIPVNRITIISKIEEILRRVNWKPLWNLSFFFYTNEVHLTGDLFPKMVFICPRQENIAHGPAFDHSTQTAFWIIFWNSNTNTKHHRFSLLTPCSTK